mgnify:CR=1 FL=1
MTSFSGRTFRKKPFLSRHKSSLFPERVVSVFLEQLCNAEKKAIMFGIEASRAKQYVDKLAVDSEQGLTNAQLMLTNHDLRPGKIPSVHRNIISSEMLDTVHPDIVSVSY